MRILLLSAAAGFFIIGVYETMTRGFAAGYLFVMISLMCLFGSRLVKK